MPTVLRIRFMVCCILACLLAPALPASADSFTVFTNNVPPFKFLENGAPSGMAGDLLKHLFAATGQTIAATRSTTMHRFLTDEHQKPGTVFLALSKSHRQGHIFKWVGPIFKAASGIVIKRSRHIRLARIADARGLVLASVIGSAPEEMLMGTAFAADQFLRFKSPQEAIRALVEDRADGLLLATAPAYHLMTRAGIDTDDYETALTLDAIPLHFAFHPDTPDAVIERLQAALDAMKQSDGTGMSPYLKIVSKYH